MNIKQKERIAKMYNEPFYLLDIKKEDKYIFTISGSTANLYRVIIHNNRISCDCPDGTLWSKKFNCICKHCCFVLIKVLKMKVPELNNDILSTLEFGDNIYAKVIEKTNNIINNFSNLDCVNQNYINKFKNIKPDNKKTYVVDKEINKDDDCGICFDSIGNNIDILIECPDCKNVIHKLCMEKWLNCGNKTCVFCRSTSWGSYFVKKDGKYINLLN
jgi:hypothetical protein